MTDIDRLQGMIDELRRLRNSCEPKSNQNPRYLRYTNAVSALLWDDRRSPGRGSSGALSVKCGICVFWTGLSWPARTGLPPHMSKHNDPQSGR